MEDRRRDRCDERPQAIAKQLEAVVKHQKLNLLIVIDDQGELVGKNESAKPEDVGELALVGVDALQFRSQISNHLSMDDSVGLTIRRPYLRGMAVRFVDFRGTKLAVVARSNGTVIDPDNLDRAVSGVSRILEGEDLKKKVAGSNAHAD